MKYILVLLIISAFLILPFCTTAKKARGEKAEARFSYVTDIAPVMQVHCSPCHFPDGGKQKFLDTYASVSMRIDDILYRVQLPTDSLRFMPFKSKKEPLNDSLIQVFKHWKSQQMPN
jgi:hypothetical protein